MGRWDEDKGRSGKRMRRDTHKILKRLIFAGFAIVAIVVLAVFIPRSGINVEIIERREVVGTMETISVKVSNNNFYSIGNVTVRFDNGTIQPIGDMGPFASVMITPETGRTNFERLTVTANGGEIEVIKDR